jgi:uncharacterized protein
MRETVEMIVRALASDAEAVDVREIERDERTVVIEVRVAEADMGKIIGRQGKTVRAIRSLLHAVSLQRERRYVLDIVE